MTALRPLAAMLALLALASLAEPRAHAQAAFGAQGAEAASGRAQDWLVPSGDPMTPSRAILFRPPGKGPFRLAIIAHASTENPIARAMAPPPHYPALSAWLVARDFAVLVAERPGHGKTGGRYRESQGGCDDADYVRAARATAASIDAALGFMRTQSFIRNDGAVIVGHSAGGLGALALAARNPRGVAATIVFSPGRGGHAGDRPFEVCAEDRLVATMAEFGKTARIPMTWIVARNDSYFSLDLSQRMADAFRTAGGKADFQLLPAFGDEGHWLAEKATAQLLDAILARVPELR